MTMTEKLHAIANHLQGEKVIVATWAAIFDSMTKGDIPEMREPFLNAARAGVPSWVEKLASALALTLTEDEADAILAFLSREVPPAYEAKVGPMLKLMEPQCEAHFKPFVAALS